jgi:hypothetical protein
MSPLISFFSFSKELELYEMYSPRHLSYHYLRSEQVEVEGMDMSEVEGMDMVEEQDHPTNHRLREGVWIWWIAIWWRWMVWIRWRNISIR